MRRGNLNGWTIEHYESGWNPPPKKSVWLVILFFFYPHFFWHVSAKPGKWCWLQSPSSCPSVRIRILADGLGKRRLEWTGAIYSEGCWWWLVFATDLGVLALEEGVASLATTRCPHWLRNYFSMLLITWLMGLLDAWRIKPSFPEKVQSSICFPDMFRISNLSWHFTWGWIQLKFLVLREFQQSAVRGDLSVRKNATMPVWAVRWMEHVACFTPHVCYRESGTSQARMVASGICSCAPFVTASLTCLTKSWRLLKQKTFLLCQVRRKW